MNSKERFGICVIVEHLTNSSVFYKNRSATQRCVPCSPKTKQVKRAVKSTSCVLGGDQGGGEREQAAFFLSKRRPEKKHKGRSVTAPPVMLRLADCVTSVVENSFLNIHAPAVTLPRSQPQTAVPAQRAAAHRGDGEKKQGRSVLFHPRKCSSRVPTPPQLATDHGPPPRRFASHAAVSMFGAKRKCGGWKSGDACPVRDPSCFVPQRAAT